MAERLYVVRVVLFPSETAGQETTLIECLRYAGLLTVHPSGGHTQEEWPRSLAFDLYPPREQASQSQQWAKMVAERMQSFGLSAVAAPDTRGPGALKASVVEPKPDPDLPSVLQQHVHQVLQPKMESSRLFVSILPDPGKPLDPKGALELGLAILLDKPIVLVVGKDDPLNSKLRAVADRLVTRGAGGPDEQMLVELQTAIEELKKERGL